MEYRQSSIFDIIDDEYNNAKIQTFRAKVTNDYSSFVDKFEIPKTTDDCYTPPAVYDCVLEYCGTHYPEHMTGKRVARPFVPGGDFERYDYTNAVVVDNPPFSILSKIVRFYVEHDIKFFLFAPMLTCFNVLRNRTSGVAVILIEKQIVYENGAKVATAFVTNMEPSNIMIRLDRAFSFDMAQAQAQAQAQVIQVFDPHLYNSTRLVARHHDICLTYENTIYNGKWAFGGGVVVSDAALAENGMYTINNRIYKKIPLTAEQQYVLEMLNNKR